MELFIRILLFLLFLLPTLYFGVLETSKKERNIGRLIFIAILFAATFYVGITNILYDITNSIKSKTDLKENLTNIKEALKKKKLYYDSSTKSIVTKKDTVVIIAQPILTESPHISEKDFSIKYYADSTVLTFKFATTNNFTAHRPRLTFTIIESQNGKLEIASIEKTPTYSSNTEITRFNEFSNTITIPKKKYKPNLDYIYFFAKIEFEDRYGNTQEPFRRIYTLKMPLESQSLSIMTDDYQFSNFKILLQKDNYW